MYYLFINIILLFSLFLWGCASTPQTAFNKSQSIPAPLPILQSGVETQLLNTGFEAIIAGDYPRASNAFNRALKLNPDRSYLHFLNGLTYHLMFRKGNFAQAELAETGYLLALQFDPTNVLASHQLGQLYLEKHHYPLAQKYLAHTLLLDGNNPQAYHGLATASYFARHLESALWAVNSAEGLRPGHPDTLRAAAMIYSAAGLSDKATEYLHRYEATRPSGEAYSRLLERKRQWEFFHEREGRWMLADDTRRRGGESEEREWRSDERSRAPQPTPAEAGGSAGNQTGPRAPSWFDCNQQAGGQGGSIQSNDETSFLPALPSPCKERPLPRMAIVDAVIIRSEEIDSKMRGINLLEGLEIVLSGSLVKTKMWSDSVATVSKMLTKGLSLPSSGISYSLNIAKDWDNRYEVMARPSLLVLDRQPSHFFSGANVSIALTGQYGGSVVDKPVGVSLSVTPTFVDDETVLLSVRAVRTFFEKRAETAIDQSMQTSRNAVIANVIMKLDQTLVLSGLSEKETEDLKSGVPLLRDVWGVKTFFSRSTHETLNKSVLILLTPRKPAEGEKIGSLLKERSTNTEGSIPDELRRLKKRDPGSSIFTPNLKVIFEGLKDNPYVLEFRTGDLSPENWSEKNNLERILSRVQALMSN